MSDQPPLPFEPAVELIGSHEPDVHLAHDTGAREVSGDAFSALLVEEFRRRSTALAERERR